MASQEISESVQHAITPSECSDLYYSGEGNTEMQCFPTLVDNRFVADLPSRNQNSTSTVVFNPDNGLSHIILTLQLPAPVEGGVDYSGWAFANNWGQSMITQVGLRIGGSGLYYFTGDEMFIDNLTDCESSDKKQAVADLAGGSLLEPSKYLDLGNRTANLYLKMPFNSISALQATLPCPSDLLTQPIQFQITFNSFANVAYWYGVGNPDFSKLPNQFETAQISFRRTVMQNSEHLLARRENMMENALTFPLRYFSQTTFRTNINNVVAYQNNPINLTGFRSGSIKYIDVWVQKLVNGQVVGGSNLNFVPIVSARLLINGNVYYDSRFNTSMWNLCDKKNSCQFSTVKLSSALDNSKALETPVSSSWISIPFSQVTESSGAYKNVVALGYPIMNSTVNLEITLGEGNGNNTYQVSAAYHYVASLMFSKNTCEYIF